MAERPPADPARVLVVYGSARAGGLGRRLVDCVLAELERAGAEPRLHDLLADGFDPVLRLADDQPHALPVDAADDPLVARYQADARWAESFVVLHPVWWFAPPALLKGWVDRVLVHDVALNQPAEGPPQGLFEGKRMLVVQTFNAQRAVDLVFLGFSAYFWKRIVGFSVGMQRVTRLALFSVQKLEPARLERFEARLRRALAGLVEGSQR